MNKVKIPKKVAEAIEVLRNRGYTNYGLLVETYKRGVNSQHQEERVYKDAIRDFTFVDCEGILSAIVNGYEIEQEDITVTITPKQQEEIKYLVGEYLKEERTAAVPLIQRVLDACEIKIDGVNT